MTAEDKDAAQRLAGLLLGGLLAGCRKYATGRFTGGHFHL